jgi:hypothetical protein
VLLWKQLPSAYIMRTALVSEGELMGRATPGIRVGARRTSMRA